MEARLTVPDELVERVPCDAMATTVERLFVAHGMPQADAAQAADVLLYADLRGIESHGVSNMTPVYVTWFGDGTINPTPSITVVRDAAAVATLDHDAGLGLAHAPAAMDLAIEKARDCGVGAVSVTGGRHFGAAAYHAHRAVEHGMVGVAMTMGGVQVLPTFGAEPRVGLNPIAVAAPAGSQSPFVFDASMSSVAGNKIRIARRLGATVAPGWIAAEDGAPIMEEAEVPDRFHMLPTGGTREGGSHKGYGLAVVVDILCGILAGNPAGFLRAPADVSHHFVAYRIDAFTDPDEFTANMETFMRGLAETPPAPGEDRVFYAGLAEAETEAERRRDGIPYHRDVVDWFRTTCEGLDLDHPL